MKKILIAAVVAVAATTAASANAATILLGTVDGNDTLAEVNTLITSYNAENSTSYQLMELELAKWNCTKVAGKDCGGWNKEDKTVDADLFDVEMGSDAKTGSFTFDGAPGTLLGAFAVKGGNGFALYYLDPALSSVTAPGIAFDTFQLWVGNGKNNPALSHITWYGFEGDIPCQGDECDPGDDVPEPASLALLGLSLLGAAYARRRRP